MYQLLERASAPTDFAHQPQPRSNSWPIAPRYWRIKPLSPMAEELWPYLCYQYQCHKPEATLSIHSKKQCPRRRNRMSDKSMQTMITYPPLTMDKASLFLVHHTALTWAPLTDREHMATLCQMGLFVDELLERIRKPRTETPLLMPF